MFDQSEKIIVNVSEVFAVQRREPLLESVWKC